MYTESEGIIFKQIKALGGRRMIVIFTEKYGKISAGTSISERGKNKSALALRPFTYGRYELFKGRESFSINGAEVIKSYYSIGEDVDKYVAASSALELTDAMLGEEEPVPGLLRLLRDFLDLLLTRSSAFDTALTAYMLKALYFAGCEPDLGSCVSCGKNEGLQVFSVSDGGLLCGDCCGEFEDGGDKWLVSGELVEAMRFIQAHSLSRLEGLALKPETESRLKKMLRSYYAFHLGIDDLKSDGLKF